MDQRTRNRLREHTGEGHALAECEDAIKMPGKALFLCTCGWKGWLSK